MSNTFGRRTETFGTGYPVWRGVPKRVVSAGILLNTIAEGDNFPIGSPCSIETGGGIKILPIWKVKASEVVETTNTKITVYRADGLPEIKAGKMVMVVPSTIAGTGKAIEVTTVDNSVAGESSFTIVTANIDAVTTGTYLALSSSATAGSAKSLYCQPTHLTYSQVLIGEGDTAASASPVYEGYVFEKRIPYLPAVVKANIKSNTPSIYFDNII